MNIYMSQKDEAKIMTNGNGNIAEYNLRNALKETKSLSNVMMYHDFNKAPIGVDAGAEENRQNGWGVSNADFPGKTNYITFEKKQEDEKDTFVSSISNGSKAGNVNYWRNMHSDNLNSDISISLDLRFFESKVQRTVDFRKNSENAPENIIKFKDGKAEFLGTSNSLNVNHEWHTYTFEYRFRSETEQVVKVYFDGEYVTEKSYTDIGNVNYIDIRQHYVSGGGESKTGFDNFMIMELGKEPTGELSENYALSKTVDSIGYDEDGGEVNYNPQKPHEYLVDGNKTTYFGTYGTVRTGSIWIDLGGIKEVNRIEIYESTHTILAYHLQYSKDGTTWFDITKEGALEGGKEIGVNGVQHLFDTIEAKFTKLNITETAPRGSSYGYDIFEMEVYYDTRTSKEELDQSIKLAEFIYQACNVEESREHFSEQSWAEFSKAIMDAKKVLEDENELQLETDRAVKALEKAVGKFKNSALYDESIFDDLRIKYVESLTQVAIGYDNDLGIPMIAEQLRRNEEEARTLWNLMIKDEGREEIFPGLNPTGKGNAVDTRATIINLKIMALSYGQVNNGLYQNAELKKDILDAFDFVINNWYNETTIQEGNWWDWGIGIPMQSTDLLLIMFDAIEEERKETYFKVLRHFSDPTYMTGQTGANRVHYGTIDAKLGIFSHEGYLISYGKSAIYKDLVYNQRVPDGSKEKYNDGFYPDGSFIQHSNVAYNGSYGKELIISVVDYIFYYIESPWELNGEKSDILYNFLYNAFIPLLYDSAMMDMVNGRAIVRKHNDRTIGYELMYSIYKISLASGEENRTMLQSILMDNLNNDAFFLNNSEKPDHRFKVPIDLRMFVENTSVKPREKPIFNKAYNMIARSLHTGKDFAFGLSMFSSRLLTFEQTNGENLKGWYTGSGMTYIYNTDSRQYTDDFWYTVDMYRMSGVTATTVPRSTDRWQGEYTSPYDWVGSSSLIDLYGSSGMIISQWESDLFGKKSWFMFDDEIVALGTNIKTTDGYEVETTVENRMISNIGLEKFIVDGKEPIPELNQSQEIVDAKYAYLALGAEASSIGYYFPEGSTINVKRDSRTEWSNHVNSSITSPEEITRNFITLWIGHGFNPQSGKYQYVMIPSKSEDFVKKYADSPFVEIIYNNGDVQAVKNNLSNVMGLNFWENKKVTADIVTSYNQASITMKEEANVITIAISDPTTKQEKMILDIEKKGISVVSADENINVIQLDPSIKLEINAKDSKSRSMEISILYK